MEKEIQQAIDLLLQHGYEVTPPQSEEEINNEFECWWNMYDKKCGKNKCLRKWVNMPKKDRISCITATPAYVKSRPVKQYRKDPFTYLNGRCWEDEIIDPYGEAEQRTAIGFATKAAAILNAD